MIKKRLHTTEAATMQTVFATFALTKHTGSFYPKKADMVRMSVYMDHDRHKTLNSIPNEQSQNLGLTVCLHDAF